MQLRDAGDGITRDSLAFYRDHRPELAALREVTVRFPAFDDPYNPYLMVLRDVDGQELLLSGCTAGYVGEGPEGSFEILLTEDIPIDLARTVTYAAHLTFARAESGWRLDRCEFADQLGERNDPSCAFTTGMTGSLGRVR